MSDLPAPKTSGRSGSSADDAGTTWLHSRIVAIETEGKLTTQRLGELSTLLQVNLAKTQGDVQGVSNLVIQIGEALKAERERGDRMAERISRAEAELALTKDRAMAAVSKADKTSDRLIGLAIAVFVAIIAAVAKALFTGSP